MKTVIARHSWERDGITYAAVDGAVEDGYPIRVSDEINPEETTILYRSESGRWFLVDPVVDEREILYYLDELKINS